MDNELILPMTVFTVQVILISSVESLPLPQQTMPAIQTQISQSEMEQQILLMI